MFANHLYSDNMRVPRLPIEIWELILKYVNSNEEYPLALVCREWASLLRKKRARRNADKWVTSLSCMVTSKSRVEWGLLNNIFVRSSCIVTRLVAATPNVELMIWCGEEGFLLDPNAISQAARFGHLKMIQYLRIIGSEWDDAICEIVAQNGYLEVLKWCFEQGCPLPNRNTTSLIELAADRRHFHVVQWLHSQGFPLTAEVFASAASTGLLSLLQWLYDLKCPWDSRACLYAAKNAHFTCLQWLRLNNCPWDERTCALAAGEGYFGMLQWCFENGCPWDSETCVNIIIFHGHTHPMYAWCRERGCPLDAYVFARVAMHQPLEIIEWLYAQNCPWDRDTFDGAAFICDLPLMKWLRLRNCPWGATVCMAVIEGDGTPGEKLAALEWCHENGCPWDEDVCGAAASENLLEILAYCFEHGCEWSELTCINAARVGNLEILKFCWHHKCPWNEEIFNIAIQNIDWPMIRWLSLEGCPWDSKDCIVTAINHGDISLCQFLLNLAGYSMNAILFGHVVHSGHIHLVKWCITQYGGAFSLAIGRHIATSTGYAHSDIAQYLKRHAYLT